MKTEIGGYEKQPMSRCPICREDIIKGALKCIQCSSDLSWRRYISIAGLGTPLAILTALVSVTATFAPVFEKWITPLNSLIRAEFVGVAPDGHSLSILVSNNGRRVGAIQNIELVTELPTSGALSDKSGFTILPQSKEGSAIYLLPGTTAGLDFSLLNPEFWWYGKPTTEDKKVLGGDHFAAYKLLHASTCSIWLHGRNSDGSELQGQGIYLNCVELYNMFRRRLIDRRDGIAG